MNWSLPAFIFYLCTLTGLYKDKAQAVWRIQNLHMQKADSFQLLWILLQMDGGYKNLPSEGIFMMEEQFERGCTSPLLYMEAWKWISEDITLFHRLSPFWIQVFCFAGKEACLQKSWLCVWLICPDMRRIFPEVCIRLLWQAMKNFLPRMFWKQCANM